MGWGFRNPLKNFNKSLKGFLISGGGVLPGIGEAYAGSDKVEAGVTDVLHGVGNLVTGGYIGQKEAQKEAQKARDQARKQYEEQQAAVEAETKRLADLDEEKRRRLAQAGTQNPQTLLGGYKGVTGGANLYKSLLGA